MFGFRVRDEFEGSAQHSLLLDDLSGGGDGRLSASVSVRVRFSVSASVNNGNPNPPRFRV